MQTHFTQYSNDSIWSIDPEDPDLTHAVEYLNNPENFRSFSSGLTDLICKYGYHGAPGDAEAKTLFLLEKLNSIGVSVVKATLFSWFTDKRRPALAANSRTLLFQICFALSASSDDIQWFFSHVYFDRVLNCHTIPEAVYYYCFTRRLPYRHALDLISRIEAIPTPDSPGHAIVFTSEIIHQLDCCSTDEELLAFFRNKKHLFSQWNRTAATYIESYVSLIRGKESDKAIVSAAKTGRSFSKSEIRQCGLVTQEYLLLASEGRFGYISGKSVSSIDFMLEQMITINSGLHKQTQIPAIVRQNFPSKKTFSDILNKSELSTSYDSIRKCLILLKFYHFWVTLLLNPELTEDSPFDIYRDETNALLTECGYDELFAGNPYDWLFLWASTSEKPLDTLRMAIGKIEEV